MKRRAQAGLCEFALPVTAIVPELGDTSIDAVTETVMSHETWVPKGPRPAAPRIGDERPRGE